MNPDFKKNVSQWLQNNHKTGKALKEDTEKDVSSVEVESDSEQDDVPDLEMAVQCTFAANVREYVEPKGISFDSLTTHLKEYGSFIKKDVTVEIKEGKCMERVAMLKLTKAVDGEPVRNGLFAIQSFIIMTLDVCGLHDWSAVSTFEKMQDTSNKFRYKYLVACRFCHVSRESLR